MRWMPALAWAVVLFCFSTSYFSAENTSRIIDPILRFLMPAASTVTIAFAHGLVRKAAHFTNYAILFWLLVSGPLRARPYTAFALCVAYALLDEGHQMFVPSRGPSLHDVALDFSGALFSSLVRLALSAVAKA